MTPTIRAKAKSRLSSRQGPIMRSTEECEISRSCQRATFSIAGSAKARTMRASPGHVLGQHRIALVRHRRRALLARRKILFRLQNLGTLQVTDLDGKALDR